MASTDIVAAAFARPGGETACPSQGRPVDLVHLARQTFGDREVEQEVLAMFAHQAAVAADKVALANGAERRRLAHTLKGSARAVGAFGVAAIAARIEADPTGADLVKELAVELGRVRDFIATVCR